MNRCWTATRKNTFWNASKTGWISSEGPFIKKFEEGVAAQVGRKHGIAVCNGTAALDVAIAALKLSPGDEVIMPTFTIISCIGEIVRAGAKPVLIDSDPVTWNMDVGQIAEKITPRTKAIMVVHIYGLPVDMDPVLELAARHGLKIIEDAAEMHGQTYKGKPCGSFGDISIFSFYPNKHITTGEGGMVLTDDDGLAEECRGLRNLCFQPQRRFVHERLGWNYRMTNLQAALGVAQLERLDEFVSRKRAMGRYYTEALSSLSKVQLPLAATNYAQNIYWVFGMVLHDDVPFDAIEAMKRLAKLGIGTRPFFYPMHQQPVLCRMGLFEGERYPAAEKMAERGFYIPSGLGVTEAQMETVAAKVRGSPVVSAFDLYSEYYDLLYRDKDYRGEADYILSLIREFHPRRQDPSGSGMRHGKACVPVPGRWVRRQRCRYVSDHAGAGPQALSVCLLPCRRCPQRSPWPSFRCRDLPLPCCQLPDGEFRSDGLSSHRQGASGARRHFHFRLLVWSPASWPIRPSSGSSGWRTRS